MYERRGKAAAARSPQLLRSRCHSRAIASGAAARSFMSFSRSPCFYIGSASARVPQPAKIKTKTRFTLYFFCLPIDPPSPVPRETLEGHPLPASPRRYSLHKRKPQFSDFIYIFTSRYPTTNQPQYSTIRFLPPLGLEKQWRLTRNLANRLGKQNRRGSKNPRLQCSAAVPIYRTKSVLSPPQLCSCP